MDEKPKKRPWFQFHLSTAVVLMFVAAGLLWLNMTKHHVCFFGWPLPIWEANEHQVLGVANIPILFLLIDVAVWVMLLLATAVTCEMRILRKSANAEPPKDGPN